MIIYFGNRNLIRFALLAQLDRVFGYEPKGQGFESLTARQEKEQIPFGVCSFLFAVFRRDSKDERHRATVRWTVVTASDQTPAGVRVESLTARQLRTVTFVMVLNFLSKGFKSPLRKQKQRITVW